MILAIVTAAANLLTAAPAIPAAPNFQANYGRAVALATEQHKPVAVFIGQGEGGVAKLVTDGTLPTEAVETLRKNFVCVYVDAATAEGKELAGKFRLTEGVVISDRTGGLQAVRHEGTISGNQLTGYVRSVVESDAPVVSTVYSGRAVAPAAVVAPSAPVYQSGCANGRCGISTATPVFQGAFQGGYALPTLGGCAGGRCPTR